MRKAFRLILRATSALLLAGVTQVALAAPATVERYPWDKRPFYCELDRHAKSPACRFDDWPTYEIARKRLDELLDSGRFTLLERALAGLNPSGHVYPGGQSHADLVQSTLGRLLEYQAQAPTLEADLFEMWRQAYPDSDHLKLAEVMRLRHSAWRGLSRAAQARSPQARELSQRRLQEAERLLLALPAPLRETPTWHLQRLKLSLELERPQTSPEAAFAEAVKRWPRDLSFHDAVLQELLPQHGGSWAAVEAFIDRSSRQVQATEGHSFYARLYHQIGDELVQQKTQVDWGRLMQGFEDWLGKRMDFQLKNLYASYACVSRDKAAFAKAMRHLGKDEIFPPGWLGGHSYEACRRWAAI